MKKIAFLSLIFLFFTPLFTYPAVFHLSDKIIGDGGDSHQFLGFQYIAKMQFEQGVFPFGWTNYWRYPVGFNFSIGYDSTLFLLTGIIFYKIFENPVVVYNLSILTLLFLNGILSYPLFKKISGNESLGILGSLIYGFSFYSIARMGRHPNLVLTGCFPFFVYSLIILRERRGDKKSFAIFTFSVILVFLVSAQYLLILIGAIILSLPIFIIFYKDIALSYLSLFWERRKNIIYSLLTIIIVFLFFNIGRVNTLVSRTLILPPSSLMPIMPPPLLNFFLPILTTAVLFALKKLNRFARQLILPLVVILVILERFPSNFYLSNTLANESFIKIVKNLDSNAVLDLPTINQWTGTRQKS